MNETWLSDQYDLLPKLEILRIPTLVIYGDHDFIPAECAAHIARAIPKAHLVTLKDCGHFSYLECPDAVRKDIQDSFHGAGGPARQSPQPPWGAARRGAAGASAETATNQ
jgi:pimeloyl-ACP methyl ester carboxylesterase